MCLCESLSKVPWHIFLSSDQTIDEATDHYTRIVLDEIHECIPSKEVLIRPGTSQVWRQRFVLYLESVIVCTK